MMNTHRLNRVAVLLAVVLVLSVPLQAQTGINDWSRISSVASGSKLKVKLKSGKTVEGNLNSVSESSISVATKNTTQDIKRDDVQTVHRVVKKSALPATMIGMAVGAGAGAALGAIGSANDTSGFDKLDHAVTAGLAVVGAIAGTVTGYFIGRSSRKKELIYEAK
jgi:small nuclear ribonucleoprotein (snRNP)-like protein